MHISRIYVKNFRNFKEIDIPLSHGVTCIIGENNTGKTNLFRALRLVIDNNVPSTSRQLAEQDIFAKADFREPNQVIVSIEFSDFEDSINSQAWVCGWEINNLDVARLTYRFRPKRSIRAQLEDGTYRGGLVLDEHYEWQIVGGGCTDPSSLQWNDDDGRSVRFSDLQHFKLEYLKDLRDVLQDLERDRVSPLRRLLRLIDDKASQEELIAIATNANDRITSHQLISDLSEGLGNEFTRVVGPAFQDIQLNVGMVEPSFAAIIRSLKILFRDRGLQHDGFQISRNGLGLNNLLYITMVLQAFELTLSSDDVAGQLVLIEEPEAHLHPQLQRTLYDVLRGAPSQVLLTSHSTHISSKAPLNSFVSLTLSAEGTKANRLALSGVLEDKEIKDLERYLDATRSTLLYARKVMLVEGPAELFLIPRMIEAAEGKNLDSLGISIIPIYGTHFESYAKLFSDESLPKKCAIIMDGDCSPEEIPTDVSEDSLFESEKSSCFASDYVRAFACHSTFERAIVIPDSLAMLIATLTEFGATNVVKNVKSAQEQIDTSIHSNMESGELILRPIREKILNQAKKRGKARFSQVASKHTSSLSVLPSYIKQALDWLLE
ncbi:MAG: AAA family ATPase [Chloroflexi bacterium]|nr:AAA family ATPase [Chloroflexota bacterium]